MKTLRNVAAAVFFFALAINTSAIAKGRHGSTSTTLTAQTAADASHRLQLIDQSLTDEGFNRTDVEEQQVKYIVKPAFPYTWGHLVYTYTRIVPGHFNMVEHVEITSEVVSTVDGFTFPQITINELLSQ